MTTKRSKCPLPSLPLPPSPEFLMLTLSRGSQDDMDEETKREHQGKRVVVDKETGKAKEVDIYDRSAASKKKDPEKLKAIFSSNLEQSIMPSSISKAFH